MNAGNIDPPGIKNNMLSECRVFILVGGLGTRLRSAYSEGPKAMAPIAGAPFLSYLLSQIKAAGFAQAVLCLGHGHKQIEDWVRTESGAGLRVEFSVEEGPLGTAGAIRLAAGRYPANQRFLVMNGDSMLQLDFSAMIDFHAEHGLTGTVGLAWVPDTSRYGSVELDEADRIIALREKPAATQSGCINGGIYVFEPEVLDRIPQRTAVSLERTVLPGLCPANLVGFRSDGYFLDIGTPQDYQRAQTEFRELSHL